MKFRFSKPRMDPQGRWAYLLVLSMLVPILASCVSTTAVSSGTRAISAPAPGGSGVDLLGIELRPTSPELLGPAVYDLPIEANTWVESEMQFLLTERREVVGNWMQRGSFYADFVRQVFREEGVPTDLYYLAMIESGYVSVARSRSGAVGIWQFMPATSRESGLRVDEAVDERVDPVRSTRAAARYLRWLHGIHGDWELAVAAYNAGTGRISRGLEKYRAVDFWDLARRGDLAAETRRYLPRLYAMTIIGQDPRRFGFEPPSVGGFSFDSLHVERSIRLDDLARATGLDPARVTELNPHLLRGTTPAGGYWVWVPAGQGQQAQRSYVAYAARLPREEATHTVRRGDTLSGLARQYRTTAERIREVNGLTGSLIRSGQPLRIPQGGGSAGNPSQRATRIEHLVQPGDTLWALARRYGTTVESIAATNGIGNRPIVPGQRLIIGR
ncbi:MAG: LysM peptidoglycan-binding domain-containing protein [Gemmatimonas sp.]|nr:LysM peptidoglycan-binding domain-containing protein [Gemmatimonas sp.]